MPVPKNPRTTTVSITGRRYRPALAAFAAAQGRTVGDVVREAVDAHFKKQLEPYLALFGHLDESDEEPKVAEDDTLPMSPIAAR